MITAAGVLKLAAAVDPPVFSTITDKWTDDDLNSICDYKKDGTLWRNSVEFMGGANPSLVHNENFSVRNNGRLKDLCPTSCTLNFLQNHICKCVDGRLPEQGKCPECLYPSLDGSKTADEMGAIIHLSPNLQCQLLDSDNITCHPDKVKGVVNNNLIPCCHPEENDNFLQAIYNGPFALNFDEMVAQKKIKDGTIPVFGTVNNTCTDLDLSLCNTNIGGGKPLATTQAGQHAAINTDISTGCPECQEGTYNEATLGWDATISKVAAEKCGKALDPGSDMKFGDICPTRCENPATATSIRDGHGCLKGVEVPIQVQIQWTDGFQPDQPDGIEIVDDGAEGVAPGDHLNSTMHSGLHWKIDDLDWYRSTGKTNPQKYTFCVDKGSHTFTYWYDGPAEVGGAAVNNSWIIKKPTLGGGGDTINENATVVLGNSWHGGENGDDFKSGCYQAGAAAGAFQRGPQLPCITSWGAYEPAGSPRFKQYYYSNGGTQPDKPWVQTFNTDHVSVVNAPYKEPQTGHSR